MPVDNQISNEGNQSRRHYQRLQRIMLYISNNLQYNLGPKKVAEKFSISISTLEHLFKQHTHQSYHHYLEVVRMRQALYLLTQEGKIVKEAMALTGYKNRRTFTRAFKRVFQQTPGYFMK